MTPRLSRFLRACGTVALIAAFVSWPPVMVATMARMQQGAAHCVPMSGTPHHHQPRSRGCCDLCVSGCVASPSIPHGAPQMASLRPEQRAPLGPVSYEVAPPAPQYRLPFSVGPPAPRFG